MPFAKRSVRNASRVGWSQSFQILKYDAKQGLAFGWASCVVNKAGALIIDHDEDTIQPRELEGGAYSFVEESGLIGDMHERMGVSSLVESCFLDDEKRAAMGLAKSDDRSVGWWIGVRVRDSGVRKKLESGERGEFSIAGEADRIPNGDGTYSLCKLSIEEVSHVDKGAGIGVAVALYKHRRKEPNDMNFAKLLAACLLLVPAKDRASLEKKLGDVSKIASMEDIKSKLTAEEWDMILSHLTPAAAEAGDPAADPMAADGADPMAPPKKTRKVAKAKPVATDEDEDEEGSNVIKLSKVLEKQAARIVELEKREKLTKYREEAGRVAKFFPASIDDVAAMLLAADEHEDKAFGKKQRDAIIKASAAIERSDLLGVNGSSRTNEDADKTGAAAVIGQIEKTLEKSEGKPGDRLKAWQKMAKNNPQAYVEYANERGRGGVNR